MSIADIIEAFLEEMINAADGTFEFGRNSLATRFECVPSQVSYVMATRFTAERGYIVESRRGGGGRIKITRIPVPKNNYLMHIVNSIGESISYDTTAAFINNAHGYGQITKREAALILAALSDNVLGAGGSRVRAELLKNMLVGLNV